MRADRHLPKFAAACVSSGLPCSLQPAAYGLAAAEGRAVTVAILTALLLAAAAVAEEPAEAQAPARKVRCAAVGTGSRTAAVEVRGTLAPLPGRDVQVAPQVAGRLLQLDAVEGAQVRKGQVLGRVDDAPLLDAARQADGALERAHVEKHAADQSLARIRRVFEGGIASRQEVDDGAARAATARAAEAEAEAASRQAHRQIGRAEILCPLDGVVLKVLRQPGELIDGTPATPVVEVADTSRMELVASVPAQDLVRIHPGAPAAVSFPALPGRSFEGAAALFAPVVDRTTGVGLVRIEVKLDASTHLPVGLYGLARVEDSAPEKVLLVPTGALRSPAAGDGEVVVCGKDGKAHVRKVRMGFSQGGFVQVEGELKPGDSVAVDPVLGLSDGDAIEAVP